MFKLGIVTVVLDNIPFFHPNNELLRPPKRNDGFCAYMDNTGQAGWFNYHCTSSTNSNYRTGYVCKREGVMLDNIFGA